MSVEHWQNDTDCGQPNSCESERERETFPMSLRPPQIRHVPAGHYIALYCTVPVSAGNLVLPVTVLTADATNEYHIHTGLELNPGPRGDTSLTT
jgi:hypothetical protein